MRELVYQLHPGQAAIFNSQARFKVAVAGRRFGKSHFAAIMLGVYALQTEHRGYKVNEENSVYYIGPTQDQAKRVMWPKLKNLLRYERQGGFIRNENTNDGWIELINKRRIYIKGTDEPDRLRGNGYQFVVLDEYADMKAEVWDDIIDPALMDVEGDALFIGTPKGKNHFYQLFMGALTKEPKVVLPDGTNYWDDWEAFHFKSSDNPFLKEREIARIKYDPRKTAQQVQQELDASFTSGEGKILKPNWFRVLPPNRIPPAFPTPTSPGGQIVIPVDLMGFVKEGTSQKKLKHKDDHAIAVIQAVEDKWYVLRIKHGKWDTRKTAQEIVLTVRDYPGSRLGIEKGMLANAIGPYLDDYMREFSRYVTPEPLSHGNTRKADRIQWALQGRAQRGQIMLRDDDDLPEDQKWVEKFLGQCADFPDPLAHDDLIDAVAYGDQMLQSNYSSSQDIEEWEALDLDAGY